MPSVSVAAVASHFRHNRRGADYVTDSPATLPDLSATQKDPPTGSATNASKGEGIAGTPHYLAPALSTITTHYDGQDTTGRTPRGCFPGGSYARGAPGNAGGGGTDGDPACQ